jgi:hypothetical protein
MHNTARNHLTTVTADLSSIRLPQRALVLESCSAAVSYPLCAALLLLWLLLPLLLMTMLSLAVLTAAVALTVGATVYETAASATAAADAECCLQLHSSMLVVCTV